MRVPLSALLLATGCATTHDGGHATERGLGARAPVRAHVLWDGTNRPAFIMRRDRGPVAWTIEGKDLVVKAGTGDLLSTRPLGSGLYHVEWLSPTGGDIGSQRNGNSGVKIESVYELQILNTPGRASEDDRPGVPLYNEAGAIYRIKAPDVNASNGAGRWQAYDIDYTAPSWDGDLKTANARMTVWWNGVLVHDDVEVPTKTGVSAAESPGTHPLLLQDHQDDADEPVRFRNIWFVPATGIDVSSHPRPR